MIDPVRVRASDLVFRYAHAERAALDGVSLELAPGLTALLGPNGSGKSTLLAALAGLHRPHAGQVALGDHDPAARSRAQVARLAAFLPAKPHVPADYSAREVVLMGRHPFGRGLLLERTGDIALADAALARAGAAAYADRLCLELSSGERQRVLLARTLCQDVPVLLLDEPTSAQDLAHAQDLFTLLSELGKAGRTVVVATHAINAAARHADRLVVLNEGRLQADGPPAEVLTRELLADVFAVDTVLGQDPDGVPYAVPRGRTS